MFAFATENALVDDPSATRATFFGLVRRRPGGLRVEV